MSARTHRSRYWVESCLSGVTAVLAAVTLVSREWIELLTGWDPDNGDGTLEWAIVIVLAIASLVFGVLARMEWRRARPVTDTGT